MNTRLTPRPEDSPVNLRRFFQELLARVSLPFSQYESLTSQEAGISVGDTAMDNKRIEVSRTIDAPPTSIFKILANPQRHPDFDGSDMLRGVILDRPITNVGDTFTMKMHRLGDDYLMINHVVEFEPDRRIFWEPAPGDASRTEGNDPSKVGIPAGYRWGYVLTPDGKDATVVTEVFDYGAVSQDLLRDGGAWINGNNSVLDSMAASLAKLATVCTE